MASLMSSRRSSRRNSSRIPTPGGLLNSITDDLTGDKSMAFINAVAGENSAAMRKNKKKALFHNPTDKAFQQLRREMEMKLRQKRKEEMERVEVSYVDRDRAAAVVIKGSKDIKNVLKFKRKKDRMESTQMAAILDEVEFDTHLFQGEHELRSGDPKRALVYLTNACNASPLDFDEPFMLRSVCLSKLGKYEKADEDADVVLSIDPFNVKGLMNKAETQYSLGRFEHSLMYFHRANHIRPDFTGLRLGIQKCKDAIENSLSKAKGFDFGDRFDIIVQIEENEKQEQERIAMEHQRRLGHSLDDASSDSSSEADHEDALELSEDERLALIMDIPPELEGLWQPTPCYTSTSEERNMRQTSTNESRKQQVKEERKAELTAKRIEKQLLGELHADKEYLEQLMVNPLLIGKKQKRMKPNELEAKVQLCAKEALDYLGVRKEFWQQQKPVYTRNYELNPQ